MEAGERDPKRDTARIKLMRTNVTVVLPGESEPVPDLGRRQPLFRLLTLSRGDRFGSETLGALFHMGTASIAPMIGNLRARLGGPNWGLKAIRNDRGTGYYLDPNLVEVDAFRFERLLEEVKCILDPAADLDEIPPEKAEQALPLLKAALELWRGNPARGLEDLEEHRYDIEFDKLHQQATRLLALCALSTGQAGTIRDVLPQLEVDATPKHDPEPDKWCLLLRAYYSLGKHANVEQTYKAAVSYFGNIRRSVPPEIENAYQRAQSNDTGWSLIKSHPVSTDSATQKGKPTDGGAAPESPSPIPRLPELLDALEPCVPSEQRAQFPILKELVTILSTIGISTASVLQLEGSYVMPLPSIRRVNRKLWFSGVLASKWVEQAAIRDEFDQKLATLDRLEDADVRFMIMNPHGDGCRRLRQMRRNKLSTAHVHHLERLARRHRCFTVRVFDHLPSFRLLFIDEDLVTFSFYRLEDKAYRASQYGLNSPHIVLDPLAPWPLAEAFTRLFEESWKAARDLSRVRGR